MTEIPPQSQPESWSELLAGYVLGDLTPAEIAIVDRYLAEHPEQQAEVESLILTLNLLPLTLPAECPPSTLKQQVMDIAQSEAVVVNDNIPIDRSKIGSKAAKWWQITIAGIGLSILGALGWQNYQLSQELAIARQDLTKTKVALAQQTNSPEEKLRQQTAQTYQSVVNLIQQPNNRFFPLKSTEKKSVSMGSLIMAPQQSSAVLTLQQVAPIPAGQVYRIWAMNRDEETACGDFIPDAEGKVLMELPFKGWQKITKVMITIEEKTAVEPEGEIAIES
jgi:Anti-sigma-K factor rskA